MRLVYLLIIDFSDITRELLPLDQIRHGCRDDVNSSEVLTRDRYPNAGLDVDCYRSYPVHNMRLSSHQLLFLPSRTREARAQGGPRRASIPLTVQLLRLAALRSRLGGQRNRCSRRTA